MEESWCRQYATGLRSAVRIQPRAGADRICGVQGGRLKIRIAAAPSVRLLQGSRSRDKLLAIACVTRLPPVLAGLRERQS
jgi:uncharacterized protein YggU (UPF0235/DUF167 family)